MIDYGTVHHHHVQHRSISCTRIDQGCIERYQGRWSSCFCYCAESSSSVAVVVFKAQIRGTEVAGIERKSLCMSRVGFQPLNFF